MADRGHSIIAHKTSLNLQFNDSKEQTFIFGEKARILLKSVLPITEVGDGMKILRVRGVFALGIDLVMVLMVPHKGSGIERLLNTASEKRVTKK